MPDSYYPKMAIQEAVRQRPDWPIWWETRPQQVVLPRERWPEFIDYKWVYEQRPNPQWVGHVDNGDVWPPPVGRPLRAWVCGWFVNSCIGFFIQSAMVGQGESFIVPDLCSWVDDPMIPHDNEQAVRVRQEGPFQSLYRDLPAIE